MTDFVEQYKQLFGVELEFDPIKPTVGQAAPRPRLALSALNLTGAPGGQQPPNAFADEYERTMSALPVKKPREEEQSDVLLGLRAGVKDIGAMTTGALEYGARQAEQRLDPGVGREVMGDVRRFAQGTRENFEQEAYDLTQRMSPEALERLSRKVFSLDPNETIFQGGPLETAKTIGINMARMAPPSLTTLLGGAILHRIGLSNKAVAYMGATEGVMSLGGIQNAVANEIKEAPVEELMQDSPRFAQLLQETQDPEAAKQSLIAEAQGMAPVIGGITVAAISAVAGRYMEPIFRGGQGNAIQRFGRGYAIEAPQEASQGAAEQIAQNVAARAYDQHRTTFQDVPEAAVEEGFYGGMFGGAVSTALGRRGPAQVERDDLTAPPTADGTPPRPDSFQDVFGEGGESPFIPPDADPFADRIPDEYSPRPDRRALTDAGQQEMQFMDQGEAEALSLAAAQGQPTPGAPREQIPLDLQPRREALTTIRQPGGEIGEQSVLPLRRRVRGGGTRLIADEVPDVPSAEPGADGDTAVQRLDEQGNVLQESLVNSTEAEALSRQWQRRYPEDTVRVLDPEEVIARREGLISEEAQARTGDLFTGYVPQVNTQAERGPPLRDRETGETVTGPDGQQIPVRRPARRSVREIEEDSGIEVDDAVASAPGRLEGYELTYEDGTSETYTPDAFEQAEAAAQEALNRGEKVTLLPVRVRPKRFVTKKKVTKKFPKRKRPTVSSLLKDKQRAKKEAEERLGESDIDVDVPAAPTVSRVAAKVIGQAGERVRSEDQSRIGGFYPPSALTFRSQTSRDRYAEAFSELVEVGLIAKQIEIEWEGKERPQEVVDRYFENSKRRKEVLKRLARIRTLSKPARKSERVVAAAETIAPGTQEAIRTSTAKTLRATKETEEDTGFESVDGQEPLIAGLTDEEIDVLEGDDLDKAFYEAAEIKAGGSADIAFVTDVSEGGSTGRIPDSDDLVTSFDTDSELGLFNNKSETKDIKIGSVRKAGRDSWRVEFTEVESGDKAFALRRKGDKDSVLKYAETFIKRHNGRAARRRAKFSKTTLESIIKAHPTPGLRRRLVRRTVVSLRGKQFGGEVKGEKFARTTGRVRNLYNKKSKGQLTKEEKQLLKRKTLTDEELAKIPEKERAGLTEDQIAEIIEGRRESILRTGPASRVVEAEGVFDSNVLTNDRTPKDESKSDRVKRLARAQAARNKLRSLVDSESREMNRLMTGRYAELANEVDEITGDPTQAALDLRYGRMYYRQVMDFGRALLNSPINSIGSKKNPGAVQQMELVIKFLDDARTEDAADFARQMSDLARADLRRSIEAKKPGGDKALAKLKAELLDPRTRAKATHEWNNNLRLAIANLIRRNNVWRKNDLYNTAVAPVMRAFAESIAIDGYASVRPSKQQLEAVNWALANWNRKDKFIKRKGEVVGSFYDELYAPIRRFFKDLGYEFNDAGLIDIPDADTIKLFGILDAGGDSLRVEITRPTDKALQGKFRVQNKKKASKDDPRLASVAIENETTASEASRTASREVAARDAEVIATRADRNADIRDLGEQMQVNRLIEQFRERISNPKMTIAGMIRQEQRLVRAMKELGIWTDTPSPIIGKIKLPSSELTKNINLAGPRLEAKKLTKDQARTLMLRLSPFKLRKATGNVVSGARKIAAAELKSETDMFLETAAVTKYGDAFESTAVELQAALNEGNLTGHSLLDTVINTVPEGHPYHTIAKRMRAMGNTDIPVTWSRNQGEMSLPLSKVGRILIRGDGTKVIINKRALQNVRDQADGPTAAAALIHTVLHELTHAATQNALLTDRGARQAFMFARTIANRDLRARGIEIPYGVRFGDRIDEFVAEVFTNTALQQQLKEIRVENNQTLWQRIVSFVRQLFGAEPETTSLYDFVMASADRVFVDTGAKGAETSFDMESITDPFSKTYVKMAGNRLVEIAKLNRVAKSAKLFSVNAPLNIMTIPQIRKEFKDTLKGLEEYYRAFKRRDARNSELMEHGARVSRQWTKLTEETGAPNSLQFSWVATQSTVHGVHPDVPLSHERNKHVTDPNQQKVHAELKAEFDKMPDSWKKHWNNVQEYYRETIERESVLLTQNALRAVLTKGANPIMKSAAFEEKFSYDFVKSLDTRKKLSEATIDMLDAEMLNTVSAMRSLPRKRTGPYFPIKRYGEYVVEANKTRETKRFDTPEAARLWQSQQLAEDPTLQIILKDGDGFTEATVNEKTFLLAESATEAALKRDELVQEFGEENVSAVRKKVEYGAASTIQSNDALGKILNQLSDNPGAQSAIRQYYLRTLSDSSFRKHEIKRKNRRGYDSKLQHRNFNNYAQSASYYTAQLEFGWQMSGAMSEMYKDVSSTKGAGSEGIRKSDIYNQIARLDKMSSDPFEISKFVRKGTAFSQFIMLTSPSYWMINATQPYMVSTPYMAARHGYGKTISAMKHAQKMIIHPLVGQAWNSKGGLAAFWSKTKTEDAFNVLDDVKKSIMESMTKSGDQQGGQDIINMLDELRRESILDLTWIAEFRDIAEGSDTGIWQRTIDASRIMSHLTEVNNRVLTAIAAYNLATTNNESKEAAIEYAKDVVATTHFDYSQGAKPLLFRPDGPIGPLAPLVFQFMQWPQHMYALMVSNMVKVFKSQGMERTEAIKIVAGMLGTHMAAGGLIGMMLDPIKWAFGLAMMLFGDDDEPYDLKNMLSGATFDRYVQEGIASFVGPGAGELLSRGIPASMGTDLSDRMSLGTLYFFDLRPETTESTLGSVLMSVGGPWLTIGENGVRGMIDIANGDVARGVERVAPKAVRDMFRTARYATNGLVNNAGDTVIKSDGIPPQELFLQSLGFASNEVSKFYNKQSLIKDKERYSKERRNLIVRDFVNAESPEDRSKVLEDVKEFNKSFPGEAVTRSTLVKAMQGRQQREVSYDRYGANLRGKSTRYSEAGWFYE